MYVCQCLWMFAASMAKNFLFAKSDGCILTCCKNTTWRFNLRFFCFSSCARWSCEWKEGWLTRACRPTCAHLKFLANLLIFNLRLLQARPCRLQLPKKARKDIHGVRNPRTYLRYVYSHAHKPHVKIATPHDRTTNKHVTRGWIPKQTVLPIL